MGASLLLLRLKLAILAPFTGQIEEFKKNDYNLAWDDIGSILPTTHRSPLGPLRTLSTNGSGSYYYSGPKTPTRGNVLSPTSSGAFHVRTKPPWWRMKRRLFYSRILFSVLMFIGLLVALFFAPFWASASAIAVEGTFDNYTVVLTSYSPRISMLRGAVKHYSRCPAASHVVIVWNAGTPPDLSLVPSAVPIRIRTESTNSLNNRFKPDSEIPTRAVLSIDDDIRIPCSDIEAAFAEWRRHPEVMVGFFPRLIEAGDGGTRELMFRGEGYVMEKERYNVVLTGAAFIDASIAFPLYWSPAVAPARLVVDDLFNGEDLLMNFVLSNATQTRTNNNNKNNGVVGGQSHFQQQSQSAIKFFRPRRRLDISKFSHVGISHNMHKFEDSAARYLRAFLNTFQYNPLQPQDLIQALNGRRKPNFCGTTIGCLYL